MSNVHHITASKHGITLTAYRGDGSALLAFDLDEHLTDKFAGFAVQVTPPNGKSEFLMNRLNFDSNLNQDSTPQDRQKQWTPSDEAPFQKYRWQHFPLEVLQGKYKYEAFAMYFDGTGNKLRKGPSVAVSLDLIPSDFAKLKIGFTRSYVSSQAYFEKFKNKDIRPLPKRLNYNTAPFEAQYEYLGYSGRKLAFDFLDELDKDPTRTLDVFAYDIDEPDIVDRLEKLGNRLRIWLDDASLHNAQASFDLETKALQNPDPKKRPAHPKGSLDAWKKDILEEETFARLLKSAGPKNVKRGHFSRFAHCKVMIQKDKNGKPIKVITGSANWSVRGLYVQANNILVFDDPTTAAFYEDVFETAWNDPTAATSATKFAKSKCAQDYTARSTQAGLPPFQVCFSPHKTDLISLKKVADAIDAASSSVLFSVMQLSGTGSVMEQLKSHTAKNKKLFWYGITQAVAEPKQKNNGADETKGVTVRRPDGKSVLVPFAFLKDQVPPPFHEEVSGGAGQVIHNKFVVVDFNGANPAVFTGSSNLASGGEKENGDNLLAIFDRSIAVLFGVEAIRLIDHFGFRAALKKAKPKKGNAKPKANDKTKPLSLQKATDPGKRWFEDYYNSTTAKFNERLVFVK